MSIESNLSTLSEVATFPPHASSAPWRAVCSDNVCLHDNDVEGIHASTSPGSGAVADVRVIESGSRSITVAWSHPLCPNGVIQRYQVYYRVSSTAQTVLPFNRMNYTNLSTTLPQLIIADLLPYTNYTIQVQAEINLSLLGDVEVEVLTRTFSEVDDDVPTIVVTASPSRTPSKKQLEYLIGDPRQIDTGRVV